jgi:sulfate permease, SulP family
MMGVTAASSDFLPRQIWNLVVAAQHCNWVTVLVAFASLAALLLRGRITAAVVAARLITPTAAPHLARAMPLVLVAIASLLSWATHLDQTAGVAVVGALPSGMIPLTWAFPADADWLAILPTAFMLSLIGFVESVTVAKWLEPIDNPPLNMDRELIAVGMANLAAASTGGYPVSGGVARTALNYSAGANTPLANAWSALVVLLCVLLLSPLIFYLPTAVLAAIIIAACIPLVTFRPFAALRQSSPPDAAAFAVTCAATLCTGAKLGLAIGIATSVLGLAYRATQAQVVCDEPRQLDGSCTLRINGWLNFANAQAVEQQIEQHLTGHGAGGRQVRLCSVHLDPAHSSDSTGQHMLSTLSKRLAKRAITLTVTPSPHPTSTGS